MSEKLLDNFIPVVPNVYDREGNLIQNVDYDSLSQAFNDGNAFFRKGEKVKVIDDTGKPTEIEPESVANALNLGYKFDTPDEQYQRAIKEHYTTGTSQAAALGLGALRGLSIGLSDPALEVMGFDMNKINALKEMNEAESIIGEGVGTIAPMFFSGGGSAVAKAGIEGAELAAKELGKKTIAQKVMQYSPTALVNTAGRSIEEKIAGSLVKNGFDDASRGFLSQSLVKSAPKIASQAFEGSVYGLGNALSEASLGDKDLNAEYLAGEMGMGALMGVGFGSALGTAEASLPYVKKAYDSTKKTVSEASKKTIANLFNVNEDVLNTYIQNKSSIDQVTESVKDLTDKAVVRADEINSLFKEGKSDLRDATQNFKELRQNHIDDLKTRQLELKEQSFELKQKLEQEKLALKTDLSEKKINYDNYKAQVSKLEDDFNTQIKQQKFNLKSEIKKFDEIVKQKKLETIGDIDSSLLESGQHIAEDMNKLHLNIVEQSRKAFESPQINLAGSKVAVQPVLDKINERAARLERLATKEDLLIAKELRETGDRLWKQAEDGYLNGDLVKEQIKSFDKYTTYSMNASTFDKGLNLERKILRHELDSSLKEVNLAYKELMKEVSSDAQLLNQLKRYGNEFESSRAIRNIDDPVRRKYELDALKKLNEKYKGDRNFDYIEKIERYLQKEDELLNLPELKRVKELKDESFLLEKKKLDFEKSLKETESYKGLKKAEQELDQAKKSLSKNLDIDGKALKLQEEQNKITRALSKKSVQDALKDTPEFQEVMKAQKEFTLRKLEKKGLQDLSSTQIKTMFKQIAEGKATPDIERKFKALIDFLTDGRDIPQSDIMKKMLKDAGILEYFDKQFKQGSANVNKWGAIGGLVGAYFDSIIGGTFGGVLMGGFVDQGGAKLAKALVDKMVSLSAIEKQTMKFAKAQSQRINNFFGTKNLGQLGSEMIKPVLIQNQDKKEVKKKKNISSYSFNDSTKLIDKFNEISTNVASFEKKINFELEEMSKYAPEQAQALKVKSGQALGFLQSKMPKRDGLEFSMKIKNRPSDYELRKFMKYWEAVDNPLVIFDSMEKGMVMPEHVETLKTVYPKMYEETLNLITQNLNELQTELPYEKRVALSQFFDVPLDPSFEPSLLLKLQKSYTPEEKQETLNKMTAGQQANVKDIDLSAKKSAAERIATRA